MALINWLLNPKIHANTYFFELWKNNMIFYTFERLDHIHNYKTCFCIFFLSEKISRDLFLEFVEISTKNRYFNIGSISYNINPQLRYKVKKKLRKTCEGPINKFKMVHEFVWNFLRFFKVLFGQILR
jgi:hypothetical protein